jgi:hypothetical protein
MCYKETLTRLQTKGDNKSSELNDDESEEIVRPLSNLTPFDAESSAGLCRTIDLKSYALIDMISLVQPSWPLQFQQSLRTRLA